MIEDLLLFILGWLIGLLVFAIVNALYEAWRNSR